MPSQAPAQASTGNLTTTGRHHRIGVFDSGLGGLSVLRALRQKLPEAEMLYVADSGHAPYGEKDVAHIVARSEHITQFLVGQGAQAIVIACNTATAVAVLQLRMRWPMLPIIGVEPGVKPAVAYSVKGRVGVLATPGTLASAKFQQLVERYGRGKSITLQPCPGLAKEIERGELDTPRLRELVAQFAEPLQIAACDTIVLGCTHYPFVRPLFEEALGPEVHIIDTAEAVARRVAQLAAELPLPEASEPTDQDAAPQTRFWSSGDPLHLNRIVKRWFNHDIEAEPLP